MGTQSQQFFGKSQAADGHPELWYCDYQALTNVDFSAFVTSILSHHCFPVVCAVWFLLRLTLG